MFWNKKKPKRKSKPRPKNPVPKHIADNINAGEQVLKGLSDGIATTQKPKNKSKKKSADEKPKKVLNPEKEFLRVFKQLTYRHNTWTVWNDFVTMFACALSNPVDKEHYDEREELYLQIIKRYSKQEQPLFSELVAHTVMALEENPEQDFLGGIFMSLNLGNEHKGQIFTPYHVCVLMAEITMGNVVEEVKEKGFISINDPCCGAGATLIAGIHAARKKLEKAGMNFQNHLLIAAQDIDMTVALMCYIQLSLLGVAGYVKIGNSLTEPMTENDSKENYWYTPMYFSQVWTLRRFFRSL